MEHRNCRQVRTACAGVLLLLLVAAAAAGPLTSPASACTLAVSLSPTSGSAAPGGSTSFDVQLAAPGPCAWYVRPVADRVPAGVTLAFSPTGLVVPVNSGSLIHVTAHVAANVPSAIYELRLRFDLIQISAYAQEAAPPRYQIYTLHVTGGGSDTIPVEIVPLELTSIGAFPDIEVTPAAIDFGEVPLGTREERRLMVRNAGRADLIVRSLSLRGSATSPFGFCDTIPTGFALRPGEAREIRVCFTPRLGGPFEDAVLIASSDPDEGAITVPLAARTRLSPKVLPAEVAVDRDPDVPYRIGDPIEVYFRVLRSAYVTLRLRMPDGAERTLLAGYPAVGGVTYVLPSTVGEPAGTRTLWLDAAIGGLLGHATCSYTAVRQDAQTKKAPSHITGSATPRIAPAAVIGPNPTFQLDLAVQIEPAHAAPYTVVVTDPTGAQYSFRFTTNGAGRGTERLTGAGPYGRWKVRVSWEGDADHEGASDTCGFWLDRGPAPSVAEISTRGHFRNETLSSDHTAYDYEEIGSIPGLTLGTDCPKEIAIIVHGYDNDEATGQDNFQTARASLRSLGYDGPVVGFTWDSNTRWGLSGAFGFDIAKAHAVANGKKLANFIDDLKARCPEIKIHLIGHSMGARLILEAIHALANDPYYLWNRDGRDWKIDDVHLLGAAVDNEEPQTDQRYGAAIQNEVGALFNYWNAEDDVLSRYYWLEEADQALGEDGIEKPSKKPSNYTDIDVESEVGDNHSGYFGTRDGIGQLTDDGAMNRVKGNFR